MERVADWCFLGRGSVGSCDDDGGRAWACRLGAVSSVVSLHRQSAITQTPANPSCPQPWPPTTSSTTSSTVEEGTACAPGNVCKSRLADSRQSGRCPHGHAGQSDHRAPHRAPAGHEDPRQLRQGCCRRSRGQGQGETDVQGGSTGARSSAAERQAQ